MPYQYKTEAPDRLATTIMVVCLVVFLVASFYIGLKRQAKVDCLKLQSEASWRAPYSDQNAGGYYITGYEHDKCADLGIDVNAPVRSR